MTKIYIASFSLIPLISIPLITISTSFVDFKQKDDNGMLIFTKLVETSESEFLDENLFQKSTFEQENIANFKLNNKIPSKSFENDDSQKTEGNGAPYIRLGGGLFLDYDSEAINQKIDNNIYAASNFVSIKNQKTHDDESLINNTIIDGDNYAKRTYYNDLGRVNQSGGWRHSADQKFDFSKTQNEYNDETNLISNIYDLDLTPNHIYRNGDSIKSNVKEAFRILFNEELYNWYWQTWGPIYKNPIEAAANINNANIKRKALDDSQLTNSPKISLSLSWNQLVENDHELPWYAKAAMSFGNATLGTLLDKVIPGLGLITSGILDFALPDEYTAFNSKNNMINYFSPSLDVTFWSKFFNEYLGTPNNINEEGLINEFYKKYNELPSIVNLNDFDFFIPYSTMNINSDFQWITINGAPNIYNNSQSQISLSELQIKLGANFTLSKYAPSIQELITKLPTLFVGSRYDELNEPYNASDPHNAAIIMSSIVAANPEMTKIVNDLSFVGMLKKGETNNIEIFYLGQAQNITLPFKVLS